MQELNAATSEQHDDGLFLERLDAFCMAEIKAFAERERRPLEEVEPFLPSCSLFSRTADQETRRGMA